MLQAPLFFDSCKQKHRYFEVSIFSVLFSDCSYNTDLHVHECIERGCKISRVAISILDKDRKSAPTNRDLDFQEPNKIFVCFSKQSPQNKRIDYFSILAKITKIFTNFRAHIFPFSMFFLDIWCAGINWAGMQIEIKDQRPKISNSIINKSNNKIDVFKRIAQKKSRLSIKSGTSWFTFDSHKTKWTTILQDRNFSDSCKKK